MYYQLEILKEQLSVHIQSGYYYTVFVFVSQRTEFSPYYAITSKVIIPITVEVLIAIDSKLLFHK